MSLETTIEEETYSKGDDKRLRLRHLFISLLVVFLVTSFSSKIALAEESDVYQLYQTTEEVTLEQGITILKGTYLYGQQVEDTIEVQFSNTSVMIPLSSVTSIEPSEDAPEFVISSSNNESIQIPTNTKAFSVTSDVESLLFHNDVVYPVHMDAESTTIILGNTYFVIKDDLVPSNEKDVTTDPVEEDVKKETNEAKPKEEINKVTKPNNESKIISNLNKTTSLNTSTSTQQVDWKSVTHFKALVDLPVYDNRTGNLVKIGELKKGQVYPRVSDYGNWHRIQFGNIYGYVRKADTIPANKSSIKNENNNQYTNQSNSFITLKNVTVYDNTSGSLVPFGVIDKGISFPIATDYGNWWRVIYSDRVGYVRKSDVEVEREFTKNDKYFKVKINTAIYDNRTGKLVKVGELVKGQVYPRVSDYGNWHRIQFGNIYGYVRKADTIPANGTIIKNENKNYTQQSRTFTALQNVTVYDNTSGTLVPFGTIDKEVSFPIVSDYGNWWRVIYSDRVGYVRKSEVEVDFTKSDKYFKANENLPVYDNRTGQLVKVGELVKGQVYPRVSDYGNWHRIQFGNIYGYVRKADTSVATSNGIKNINKEYKHQSRTFTTLQAVTVYDNSSGKLVPYGTIDQGVSFPIATDYGNWWRIVFADRVGYVNKSEVQIEFTNGDKYFKAITDLPIYDNRTGQLVKVGELVKGQVYPRVSDYGNWHRIQFGNIYGYVRKSGTTFATGKEIKNINNGYGYSRSYIIPKQTTTVYDNTSGKLVSFGTIDKGVKFSLASDYEYGNWWRVIYADRIGYIRKSEVDATILPEIKIFIDPGHGGSDPGASSGNVSEKTLTLDIAKRIEKYLKQYDGVEINLSRTSDTYLSLSERSKMANDWGADYFVSVHINAGGGTGFESYIYNNPTKDEIDKQAIIHDHIASNIKNNGVRDRGKKQANYHVIRETNMSAILMEYLFIDTTADRNKLLDASFRDKLARLTAEGIAKAFGLQKK